MWQLGVTSQGAHARAVTVLDAVETGGLASAATTTAGTGWQATELERGGDHLAVIAVAAGPSSITYTAGPGRHVVLGAPAGASGRADVTAAVSGGGCAVTVTARADDGGFDAAPVVIAVGADCTISEDGTLDGFTSGGDGTGGGGDGDGDGGGGDGDGGGDDADSGSITGGCQTTGSSTGGFAMLLVGLALMRRRRQ